MTPLDEALAYVEQRGWFIFPTQLVPRHKGGVDKIPCVKDWPNAASRDPDQIRKWWKIWPNAVPSAVTGPRNGIVVLDVDIKSRADPDGSVIITRSGLDTLEELGWWCLPSTPIAHTRSGGLHLYFRATAFKIRNSTGNYGLGAKRRRPRLERPSRSAGCH